MIVSIKKKLGWGRHVFKTTLSIHNMQFYLHPTSHSLNIDLINEGVFIQLVNFSNGD